MCHWFEKAGALLHPHQARQEEALARLREYRELSSLALESGNEAIYCCLQKEMNQTFMEFLTWCFLDGIGSMIPHVAVMWLLNLWMPSIPLAFSLPYVGNRLPVILWYPALVISFYIGRWLVRKITNDRKNGGREILNQAEV